MFQQRLIALTLFTALAASFLLCLPAMTWAQGPLMAPDFDPPRELIPINNLIQYPEVAREKGIEADIQVEVFVDTDGSASIMKIFGNPDTVFIAEVYRIVKAERYKPANRRGHNDQLVQDETTCIINFRLSRKDKEELAQLTIADTGLKINQLKQNPGSITIEYYVANAGQLTLELENCFGHVAKVLKNKWSPPGDSNETYSTNDILPGMYRLIIRSCSKSVNAMIAVTK